MKFFDLRHRENHRPGFRKTASWFALVSGRFDSLQRSSAAMHEAMVRYRYPLDAGIDAKPIVSAPGRLCLLRIRAGVAEWEDKDYPRLSE